MKNSLLCLLMVFGLLSSTHVSGQNRPLPVPDETGPGNPVQELRESLSALNSNRIPTGVLLDRMMLITDPHRFAGQGDTSATYQGFEQQYWEFFRAALDTSQLPTLDALRLRIGQRVQQGAVPLLMLRYGYNEIAPNATNEHLITIDSANGRVYDGPDLSRSPYTTGQLFSVALPVPATATTLSVYVGPEFWLGNQPNPGYVWLDFGDGLGWRQVTMGSTVQVQVTPPATSGTLARGSSGSPAQLVYAYEPTTWQLARTDVQYSKSASIPPDLALGLVASRRWANFTPTKGVNGPNGRASAIAWIKYAPGNAPVNGVRKLRKPLVFVEGIDFAENRNDFALAGKNRFIAQTGPIPLSDFEAQSGFAADVQAIGGYRNGTAGWNEMVDYNEGYKSLEKFKDLRVQLQAPITEVFPDGTTGGGYDVIYLDFSDGASLIQHNAMVLAELLEWINKPENRTADAEETMVIGTSMGGQVARFALAWMEQQQLCHNSKLYVSFDSPHRGANVPLGIQHMFNRLQNIWIGALSAELVIKNQLRREATMQMVNLHYSDDATRYRTEWQNWQQSPNSYPSLLRKVAVANGSGQAVYQAGMVPGMEMLKMDYRDISLSRRVAGPNHAYALPGTSTRGKNNVIFRWKRGFFNELNGWHYSYADPSWSHFDTSPGSTSRVAGEADERSGPLKAAHPPNTFMPTISALDVHVAGSYTRPLLGYNVQKEIPFRDRPDRARYAFDAYFAADDKNEPHVQITNGQTLAYADNGVYPTDNSRWIQNELRESAHQLPAVLRSGTYNFGSRYRPLLASVYTGYGTQLLVNDANTPVSGGTAATQGRPPAGRFELFTSQCGTRVTVGYGSWMRLGMAGSAPTHTASLLMAAHSLLYVDHNGELEVNPGSVLRIARGATLRLHRYARLLVRGQVIVEEGAFLCVEDPASIQVSGAGSYTVQPGVSYFANPALGLGTLACTPAPPVPVTPLQVPLPTVAVTAQCTSGGQPNWGQWTAKPTGGQAPYTYAWYLKDTGNTFVLQPGATGATFGTCMNSYPPVDGRPVVVVARVVVTSGTEQVSAQYFIQSQTQPAIYAQLLYPNPADGYVEVGEEEEKDKDKPAGHQPKPMHVKVYNGQGKEIFKADNVPTAKLRIDTQTWPNGLYQVTVERDKASSRRTLSIQH